MPTPEEARDMFMRHEEGETWKEIGWWPQIDGHPRSGEVDPDEVEAALRRIVVPDDLVAGACPWPDHEAASRAVEAGQLVQIDESGSAGLRVLITPDARDALTRPDWRGNAVNVERVLRRVASRARLVDRFGTIWSADDSLSYTALVAFRLEELGRDFIITLWSQVRKAVLAADREWRARVDAEYAAGRDPFPGP